MCFWIVADRNGVSIGPKVINVQTLNLSYIYTFVRFDFEFKIAFREIISNEKTF